MRHVLLFATLALLAGCVAGPYTPGQRQPLGQRAGMSVRETRFEGVGGVKILTRSWRPVGPARAQLVVVHGLKDHGDRYAELAATMVERGFAVHALDLRGHGDSEGARAWVDSFDDYVQDLATFVDRVRAIEPDLPVFVFGHSMGGAIVTLYVLDRKPELAGVVLSAPALERGEDLGFFTAGLVRVLGTITPSLGAADLPDANFSQDPKNVAAMGKDPLIVQGPLPAHTARELLNALDRITAAMEGFGTPVLVLHGTVDKLTNVQGSRDLVARAKVTDKKLQIYEGFWHDLIHEPGKARVLADVKDWLEARAPKGE